jgi:uncharacterized protein
VNLPIVHFIIGLFLFILVTQVIIRLIRHHYKFPLPAYMVGLIDNPLRRKIQPPTEMPLRHGIELGMRVLEVGPGNGTYTVETAHHVGPLGKVIAVDIQPKVIKHLNNRVFAENITNIEGKIADVHHLPFLDGVFDAIYMIAVIGEIPNPERVLREFYRVLTPSGTLAFSELLPDPDYPSRKTLTKWANLAGFQTKNEMGNFFAYTKLFEKVTPQPTRE